MNKPASRGFPSGGPKGQAACSELDAGLHRRKHYDLSSWDGGLVSVKSSFRTSA
jgi:hypothetical protein